jgi:hypothetical protein
LPFCQGEIDFCGLEPPQFNIEANIDQPSQLNAQRRLFPQAADIQRLWNMTVATDKQSAPPRTKRRDVSAPHINYVVCGNFCEHYSSQVISIKS